MTDYTPQLRALMQPLGFTSFRAFSRATGLTDWQIEQLRRGKLLQLRVETLQKLSQGLQQPIDHLITLFSSPHPSLPSHPPSASAVPQSLPPTENPSVASEYLRLQTQLAEQETTLQQKFQQDSLQILESWLLYFPTAAHAAQQDPQLPATRLLPLMQPMEQLLKTWGVEPVGAVGEEVAFDPQYHQLKEGTAEPGELVKIRNLGYRQGERLLYRATVIPVVGLP